MLNVGERTMCQSQLETPLLQCCQFYWSPSALSRGQPTESYREFPPAPEAARLNHRFSLRLIYSQEFSQPALNGAITDFFYQKK